MFEGKYLSVRSKMIDSELIGKYVIVSPMLHEGIKVEDLFVGKLEEINENGYTVKLKNCRKLRKKTTVTVSVIDEKEIFELDILEVSELTDVSEKEIRSAPVLEDSEGDN